MTHLNFLGGLYFEKRRKLIQICLYENVDLIGLNKYDLKI